MSETQESLGDDGKFLHHIAYQNIEAFELFYDRHAKTVYSLLLCIVHEPSVAEELLQETFWQIWQKANPIMDSVAVAAWLHRTARAKALDQVRRKKAHSQAAAQESQGIEQVVRQPQPQAEQSTGRLWDRQSIMHALEQLPKEERLCLEMAYFQGMSHQQIAAHTQTPVGTIKEHIGMGLRTLERLLRSPGDGGE